MMPPNPFRRRIVTEVQARGMPGDGITAIEKGQILSDLDRVETQRLDVRAFGAVGDGVADDTQAILDCIDACMATSTGHLVRRAEFFIPASMNCRVSAQLNLRYIWSVNIQGQIQSSYTAGPCVIIGHSSNSSAAIHVYIKYLDRIGASSHPVLRAVGIKNGNITVDFAPSMQVWADTTTDATNDGSTAYSRFNLGFVTQLELAGQGALSWINRNKFYGNRLTNLTLKGPYKHNDNEFHGVFENATLDFQTGEANYVYGRFEYTNTVTFGSDANFNHIVQVWNVQRFHVRPNVTVTDNGLFNYVYTTAEGVGQYESILRIDSGTPMANSASPFPVGHATRRLTPGFRKVYAANTFTNYVDTGVFPVRGEGFDLSRLEIRSDVAMWRLYLYTYDANMNPIQGLAQTGAWSWNSSDNRYNIAVDYVGSGAPLLPSVAFARIMITSGASAGWFEYLEIRAHTPPGHTIGSAPIVRGIQRQLSQSNTTPPTSSILPQGTMIGTDTGFLVVTHRQDYTTAVHPSGGTFVNVGVTVTGVSAGDNVAVELANGQTHFTTVVSVSTSFINLTDALPSGTSSSGRVATQRWKHITG